MIQTLRESFLALVKPAFDIFLSSFKKTLVVALKSGVYNRNGLSRLLMKHMDHVGADFTIDLGDLPLP